MITRPSFRRYDAVIVGARCAGAATAMLLARRGLKVLALDRQDYASDTLSTHALMRGAVIQLNRWGLLDAVEARDTPAIRHTVFHYGGEEVAIPMKPGGGVDALYAPRRTVLDRILVDAAVAAGAEVRHGARVVDLLIGPSGRVAGILVLSADGTVTEIGTDLVIGADGRRSLTADRVGAETVRTARHKTASIYGYFTGFERDRYRWYYDMGVAASLIPTNDDAACVCLSVPDWRFYEELRFDLRSGFDRVLGTAFPELAAAVSADRQIGPLRAFAGAEGFMRKPHGPGWALVGDAAYFKDPATAHGITDAFRDAELVADAATAGTDAAWNRYEQERDELSVPLFDVTDEIASFDWSLQRVGALHMRLNDVMRREVERLGRRNDEGSRGIAAEAERSGARRGAAASLSLRPRQSGPPPDLDCE